MGILLPCLKFNRIGKLDPSTQVSLRNVRNTAKDHTRICRHVKNPRGHAILPCLVRLQYTDKTDRHFSVSKGHVSELGDGLPPTWPIVDYMDALPLGRTTAP